MDLYELIEQLRGNELIEWRSLSIGQPFRDETLCLERHRSRGLWSVFYLERGERTSVSTYLDEDDACREFLRGAIRIGESMKHATWHSPPGSNG